MNWQHFQTLVWLRWRLMNNQWRRAGAFNAVLMVIVSVGVVLMAVPLFIGSFFLGFFLFPKAEPVHLLYVWDGIVLALAFFWSIGLITELQRSEPLSLSRFLHLPVSVTGAFLINYVSSLVRISLILFVPVMLGLALAQIYVMGLAMLLVLPALAAFLLMLTGITYQFQGWLSTLMSNPRRRRTVIVVTTMVFVMVMQLPNLLNFVAPWHRPRGEPNPIAEEMAAIDRAFQAGEFDVTEYQKRQQDLQLKDQQARHQADQELKNKIADTARLVNLAVPIGWLPLGVQGAADGNGWQTLLGTLGMGLIGSASLWRAHRTTLKLYLGQSSTGSSQPAARPVMAKSGVPARPLLLEWRLPGLSEPVSGIALGGFRSLLRSPEAKMMLLTPLILGGVFGMALLKGARNFPDWSPPFLGVAAMFMVLFGLLQLMANQFGFDRDGFRVYVLSSASRRDILLGKNLSFAPLGLGMSLALLTLLQVLLPMRVDHFLAMLPQFLSMYLLFCLLANLLSIYAPFFVAAGSLKPANPKFTVVLLQMALFMFLFPLTQAPTLLPLGIEALLKSQGWIDRAPVCLMLSLAECAVVLVLYHLGLIWQGELFQSREQRILEQVSGRGT
ncbi:MAG: hypothetical protein ACKV0T_02610 [Planctomycetales bacterium]